MTDPEPDLIEENGHLLFRSSERAIEQGRLAALDAWLATIPDADRDTLTFSDVWAAAIEYEQKRMGHVLWGHEFEAGEDGKCRVCGEKDV